MKRRRQSNVTVGRIALAFSSGLSLFFGTMPVLLAQDAFVLRPSATNNSNALLFPVEGGSNEEEATQRTVSALPTAADLNAERVAFGMQGPASTSTPELIEEEALTEETSLEEALTTGSIERAEASGPLQSGVGSPLENPYDAPGVRLGSFLLRPSVEVGSTFTKRTTRRDDGAGLVTETEEIREFEATGAVAFEGDLGATQVAGEASLTFPYDIDEGERGALSAAANVEIIREFAGQQQITSTASYEFVSEDPISGAVEAATGGATDPIVTTDPGTQTFSGTIGYQRPVGPVIAGVTVGASRTFLGEVSLSDGSTISQSDLNSTEYTAQLRGGLNTGALVSPFTVLELGLRRFDEATDTNGLDRNSSRIALRGGISFDYGEKLAGEISAGYLFENIEQKSLSDLQGLSLAGELNWSPRRDIDLGVTLTTETQPTGLVNSSGAIVYSADLTAAYQARADLSFNGALNVEHTNGFGGQADQTSVGGQIGATYWFNRFAGLTGRLGYDQTISDDEESRSEEWSAFLGLRLQR
ncbi:MAG: outer membrane beta-barrel protein [Pseudomonadota bacterium]